MKITNRLRAICSALTLTDRGTLLGFAGLGFLAAGAGLQWGTGYGLMLFGAVLILLAAKK